MSILISPSNNSGWGLGVSKMYGGARERSDSHPVLVRQHYRAPWGIHKGRRRRGTDSISRTIESVVRRARRYKGRRGRRSAADPVSATIESVVRSARRYKKGRRTRVAATPQSYSDAIESVVAAARDYQPAAAPMDTVSDAIESVVASARGYKRKRDPVAASIERVVKRARRYRDPVSRTIDNVVRSARLYRPRRGALPGVRVLRRTIRQAGRRARLRARAAARAAARRGRRGNIYLVRDASGNRVPVRVRPPRQ